MVILLSKLYGCQTVLHRWLILELKMLYVVIPNEKKKSNQKIEMKFGWHLKNGKFAKNGQKQKL